MNKSPLSLPKVLDEHLGAFIDIHTDGDKRDSDRNLDPDLCLQTVIGIGAIYSPEEGLSRRDQDWMRNAASCCRKKLGLHLSEKPRVIVVNKASGHDFLDPKFSSIPADAIISCLVCNPKMVHEIMRYMFTAISDPAAHISPRHLEKDVWSKTAEIYNPKIIITFSSEYDAEIKVRDFKGPNYVPGPSYSVLAQKCPGEDALHEFNMETLIRKDIAKRVLKLDC